MGTCLACPSLLTFRPSSSSPPESLSIWHISIESHSCRSFKQQQQHETDIQSHCPYLFVDCKGAFDCARIETDIPKVTLDGKGTSTEGKANKWNWIYIVQHSRPSQSLRDTSPSLRRVLCPVLTDQYEMTIRQNPFLCPICNAPLEIIPCLPPRTSSCLFSCNIDRFSSLIPLEAESRRNSELDQLFVFATRFVCKLPISEEVFVLSKRWGSATQRSTFNSERSFRPCTTFTAELPVVTTSSLSTFC